MPITYDLKKDLRFKEGKIEGKIEGEMDKARIVMLAKNPNLKA